jgi:hypothetical protein
MNAAAAMREQSNAVRQLVELNKRGAAGEVKQNAEKSLKIGPDRRNTSKRTQSSGNS